MTKRREFLQWGSRSLAAFLLGPRAMPAFGAAAPEPLFTDPAELGTLGAPDENGLRLLPGFRSRVIARSSHPVLPGSDYLWHADPDGGACYAQDDGGWIYVSNSEVKVIEGGGGVGAVRFNAAGEIVAAYPILKGTDNNCAGGKTPWQTWLSCEEVDRGQVWECDPTGATPGVLRPALGSFKHEAVAIDPVNGHLYLTEDEIDGGFYRFIPANGLPDLSAGTLQIAELLTVNSNTFLTWHDVPDPGAATERTSLQLASVTHFNGGEGIAWHDGVIHFTTKGDNRVWRYETDSMRIEILYDAATAPVPHLSGVDNVVITASGDVLVAEDGGDLQIVLLGPDGLVLPIMQVVGHDLSEICGPAFDPSYQRLYFSSQRGATGLSEDGVVYEISRV